MIKLVITGKNAPGGSKKIVKNRKTGRFFITDDAKNNAWWKSEVAKQAIQQIWGFNDTAYKLPLFAKGAALKVYVYIFIARPDGHWGTCKNADKILNSAKLHPTVKPDATKLWRSTEDALTGIVWQDDAQIVVQQVVKAYSPDKGVEFVVIKIIPLLTDYPAGEVYLEHCTAVKLHSDT